MSYDTIKLIKIGVIILSEKLSELISKANIPEQLKTYFKESNEGKAYLNESMLSEIEELYTFYNALYIFDETDFSFYTINSLKRGSEAVAYYYYLRKILESNLDFMSKDQRFHKNSEGTFAFKTDVTNLNKKFMNIASEFGQNVDYFYKNQYDKIDIMETYLLLGKLELINDIVRDEYLSNMYQGGKRVLENKIEELGLQLYIKKHKNNWECNINCVSKNAYGSYSHSFFI